MPEIAPQRATGHVELAQALDRLIAAIDGVAPSQSPLWDVWLEHLRQDLKSIRLLVRE